MAGSSAITKAINVVVKQPLLEEIEKFRRGEADIPSRPAAVRRLLQQAVNARREVGEEPTAA
jgi:hypothetical protein